VSDRGRFESRTAAVTGAGGFIGEAVCRRLVAEGAEVRGIDVDAGAASRVGAAGAAFVEADVAESEAMREALEGAELVVHAAALVHEWGSMADFVRVNVAGTANVVDAAAAAGAAPVVHISSVVVYGYDDASEQDETAFRRAYGIPYIDTKSASDRLASRRGAIVIRPGDVYGPGSVPWTIRPAAMARAGQLAVPLPGDGLMLPLYVDDLAEAVVLALERGEPGHAYAVWDDSSPIAFEEHFNRLARTVGGREARRLPRPLLELTGLAMEGWARLHRKPPPFAARSVIFIDRRGTVSAAKARAELGWEPRVSYEEGMRRTAAWLRERPLAASSAIRGRGPGPLVVEGRIPAL
jgi:nucleoside-diphosphate-sugar epimerase